MGRERPPFGRPKHHYRMRFSSWVGGSDTGRKIPEKNTKHHYRMRKNDPEQQMSVRCMSGVRCPSGVRTGKIEIRDFAKKCTIWSKRRSSVTVRPSDSIFAGAGFEPRWSCFFAASVRCLSSVSLPENEISTFRGLAKKCTEWSKRRSSLTVKALDSAF